MWIDEKAWKLVPENQVPNGGWFYLKLHLPLERCDICQCEMRRGELKKSVFPVQVMVRLSKSPCWRVSEVTDFYLFFSPVPCVSQEEKKHTLFLLPSLSLCCCMILRAKIHAFSQKKPFRVKKLNVLKNSPTKLSAPSRNDVTPFELEFLGFYDTHSFQNWQQRFFPISLKEGFGFCCFTHPDLCRIKNLDKGVCAIFCER